MIALPYPTFCFAVFTAALTTVSLLPAETLSGASFNDKIAHFLCYALFALLAAALNFSVRRYLFVCLALAIYGLLLEGAQSLVPGRESSLLDALANTAGVAFTYISLYAFNRIRAQSRSSVVP